MLSTLLLWGITLFTCSVLFSYFISRILARYMKTVGAKVRARDNGTIRWANASKPLVGGFAFFGTFLAAAGVIAVLYPESFVNNKDFVCFLIVGALGFVIGLADDLRETRPLIKLSGQIACGLIMILFGASINLTGFVPFDYLLTMFWFVGIMNSVNLLDNMDGVTGTIASTILISTLAIMAIYNNPAAQPFFILIVAVLGSLAGFLLLNWTPAHVWMGDTGSQFLGAILAFIGVKFFWNIPNLNNDIVTGLQIVTPVMAFLVCIMDTSFVTYARIARGVSPFQGGRDHITHHLTYVGVPVWMVPLVLGFVSLGSGLMVLFTVKYFGTNWGYLYTFIFCVYIAATVAVFFRLYKRGERIAKEKNFHEGSRINMKEVASLSERATPEKQPQN